MQLPIFIVFVVSRFLVTSAGSRCPEFALGRGLQVLYTPWDSTPGSIAKFRCQPPATLVGRQFSLCLDNGTWSDSLPICKTPTINNPSSNIPGCLIGELSESLPYPVVPKRDDVTQELHPINSELPLLCDGDMVLIDSMQAVCGRQGRWKYGKPQCVSGCHFNMNDKSSKLLIEPVKRYYRVGEFALFSCSPGYSLNSEVIKVVCMGSSWSDSVPDCIKESD